MCTGTCLLSDLFTYLLFYFEPELPIEAGWSASAQDLPVSSPVLSDKAQICVAVPSFYLCAGNLSSDPNACAEALTTEPSSHPSFTFLNQELNQNNNPSTCKAELGGFLETILVF